MKPQYFEGNQGVLHAPPGWTPDVHGECEGLPVLRHKGIIYSSWRFSWRERFKVLLGKPLCLAVVGKITMPPVSLNIGEVLSPVEKP